ncbi:MAG TPA: MFS transporter, partial [Candidatus Limnocylindria bacterium]|nr:MFS transporter [Candidatus Limnocylindria bacterium]
AGLVAFPIVMDGAAGRDGRFDLLGRRWAIAGVSTALAVAIGGHFLNAVPFPMNFELVLVFVTIAGVGSFLQSSRIVIPDQARPVDGPAASAPVGERLRSLWGLVTGNRTFVRFELRSLLYTAAIGLSMPILPLFYVHDIGAPDAWIGIIGSATSAGSVFGYVTSRRIARRRGGSTILMPAMLAMAVAPAVMSFVEWRPGVAAIGFVIGISGAAAQLALFDALMRRIPAENGVTFSSVDQTVQNLALIVTPNIGGLIAAVLGGRGALLVVAAVGFASFAAFAWAARASRAAVRRESVAAAREPAAGRSSPAALASGGADGHHPRTTEERLSRVVEGPAR